MARMSIYTSILYQMVETSKEKTKLMNYAALIHDIGKIGIPDSILLKPGKLTSKEFEIMKAHIDVFDALSTERVYKKDFTIETCIKILKQERNKHFEGELVDPFLENIDKILLCKKNIDLRFSKAANEDVFTVLFNNPLNFFIKVKKCKRNIF